MTTTVNPQAFAGMLADVARTADADDLIPMLHGVLLHTAGGGKAALLVATSTDRYSLSQAHVECTGKLPEMFISLPDVKRILAVLKAAGKGAQLLHISATKSDVTFDVVRTVSVTVERNEVPRWAEGLPGAMAMTDEPEAKPVDLNGKCLARFTAIATRRGESLRVHVQSPVKPVHVFIGEDFRGLLMPRRPSEEPAANAPVFEIKTAA